MIKRLMVITVCIMFALLAIAGCTSLQQTTQSASSPSPESSSMDHGIMVAIRAVSSPGRDGNVSLQAGYKWIAYNATVLNVNASDRAIAQDYFSLQDTQGQSYNVSRHSDALGHFDSSDHSQPDDSFGGPIVFELPQDATPLSVTYADGTARITTTV